MSYSAATLLNGKALTDDGAYRVREIYFDQGTWALRHVVIDTGRWFGTDEVLLRIDRFDVPTDAGWPLAMSQQEIEDAPRIEEAGGGTLGELPPLVVGPFGNTFSPLLFAATQSVPAPPEERDGTGPEARMRHAERLSDWLGRPAFTDGGSRGEIVDMRVDDRLRLTHAEFSEGDTLSLARFRRIAEQGHALFD